MPEENASACRSCRGLLAPPPGPSPLNNVDLNPPTVFGVTAMFASNATRWKCRRHTFSRLDASLEDRTIRGDKQFASPRSFEHRNPLRRHECFDADFRSQLHAILRCHIRARLEHQPLTSQFDQHHVAGQLRGEGHFATLCRCDKKFWKKDSPPSMARPSDLRIPPSAFVSILTPPLILTIAPASARMRSLGVNLAIGQ